MRRETGHGLLSGAEDTGNAVHQRCNLRCKSVTFSSVSHLEYPAAAPAIAGAAAETMRARHEDQANTRLQGVQVATSLVSRHDHEHQSPRTLHATPVLY